MGYNIDIPKNNFKGDYKMATRLEGSQGKLGGDGLITNIDWSKIYDSVYMVQRGKQCT